MRSFDDQFRDALEGRPRDGEKSVDRMIQVMGTLADILHTLARQTAEQSRRETDAVRVAAAMGRASGYEDAADRLDKALRLLDR